MAVVSCKQNGDRRRSTSRNGVVTHVLGFIIVCDNANDGTAVAMYATGLPREGDSLNGDSGTLCTGVDVQPQQGDGTGKVFIAEVTYESTTNQFDSRELHPLDREPEYSQSGESAQENYFLDCSKPPKPYTNSAGDTFETLGEREGGEITLTVSMNLAHWTVFDTDAYRNTTNSDIVFVDGIAYGIDVLRMGVPSSTKTSEAWQGQQVSYYKVSFPIRVSAAGHKDAPLDYGYNTTTTQRKTVKGQPVDVKVKVPILDSVGMRVSKPWPLDGNGQAKPSAIDQPATLDFQPYRSVSWAAIGLR